MSPGVRESVLKNLNPTTGQEPFCPPLHTLMGSCTREETTDCKK